MSKAQERKPTWEEHQVWFCKEKCCVDTCNLIARGDVSKCSRLKGERQWYFGNVGREMVNHPSHYNHYPIETIDMMVSIFGKEATRQWCIMTAFKYRMRLGLKDDIKQDLEKEQWYLKKAEELSE